MRFSISEVSTAASGSSTRHGTLKSAGMTPSAASSCNALSRRPPAVDGVNALLAGRGVNDEVLLQARAPGCWPSARRLRPPRAASCGHWPGKARACRAGCSERQMGSWSCVGYSATGGREPFSCPVDTSKTLSRSSPSWVLPLEHRPEREARAAPVSRCRCQFSGCRRRGIFDAEGEQIVGRLRCGACGADDRAVVLAQHLEPGGEIVGVPHGRHDRQRSADKGGRSFPRPNLRAHKRMSRNCPRDRDSDDGRLHSSDPYADIGIKQSVFSLAARRRAVRGRARALQSRR